MPIRTPFRKTLSCLGLLLAAAAPAAAQVLPWKQLGPWGGTVKQLRYSKGGDTLYALSSVGLHRSVGKDGKWETIPTTGAFFGMTEFAVHGETVIMLGSGLSTSLSVSQDLGKTWKKITHPDRYDHLAYRGGVLYLSRDTLVFRSENLGDSVVQAACANLTVNTTTRRTTIGYMDLLGDTLFVSGGDIFYTADKGETFSTMGTPENPTAVVAMSTYKGEVFAIGNFGKTWRKAVGGFSWSLVKTFNNVTYSGFTNLAIGGRRLMITGIGAFDFTDATETPLGLNGMPGLTMGGMLVLDTARMLVGATGGGSAIYQTLNGGTDWQRIAIKGNGVVCFAKTDTALYAGGGNDVFKGSLDGLTWKKVDSSMFGTMGLVSHSSGLYRYANGLHRSVDGGVTWQKSDSGFPGTTFRSFLSGAPGVFALSDSGLHRLADDGASWSYARPWVKSALGQAAFISGDTIQLVMKSSDSIRVLQTTNKGAKWDTVGRVKTGSTSISVTAFMGETALIGADTVFGILRPGVDPVVVNGGPLRHELALRGGKVFVRGRDAVYTVAFDALPVTVRKRLAQGALREQWVRFLPGHRAEVVFTSPARQALRLEVYSLSGRLLARKRLGVLEAGRHRLEIDLPAAASPLLGVVKAGAE